MRFELPDNYIQSSLLDSLLQFSRDFEVFSILNSNQTTSRYVLIAAFGAKTFFTDVNKIELNNEKWKFGYLSYDLKNTFENLQSANADRINAPQCVFFEPKILIIKTNEGLEIIADSVEQENEIYAELQKISSLQDTNQRIIMQQATSKEEYLNNLSKIKMHIGHGDIYEMNYCMEFYADDVEMDPANLYQRLNEISEAPFSFYFRANELYIIGSSPERFLKKENSRVITQPIKGTAPRSSDNALDEQLKNQLYTSEKERNENVMIVDVSRNDLSRIAKRGTIKVDELFGIYSFKQVHQMISTVSCELEHDKTFQDIMQATFPPASMTGAPKIRAMQLIDEYENFKRGIYSGVLGYINDEGDFDFNVVIRTIVYNSNAKKLSYAVGSAITDKCIPEDEYNECLIKAAAMKQVLEG